MKRKVLQSLILCLLGVAGLCVVVFSIVTMRMNKKGAETIREIGEQYMSDMGRQVGMHLGSTIELRLNQVEGLVHILPQGVGGRTQLDQPVIENAQAAGFQGLAFYREDGSFQSLFGPQIEVTDKESFQRSIEQGRKRVCIGSADGEEMVLMAVPSRHDLGEGRSSSALVAYMPSGFVKDLLFSGGANIIEQYSIIREDGTYVIRGTADMDEEDFFQRIREKYELEDGGVQLISQIKEHMAQERDFTGKAPLDGAEKRIYCTKMPSSEWYLLLSMPYGMLDRSIDGLGRAWSRDSLTGCILILAALMLVFAWYIRQSNKQVNNLTEARKTAERALTLAVEARREAERAQAKAERASQAKSEFLSNMSHDIRTPMNAIVGMTAIANANIDDAKQVQNCLKKITLSSQHLLGLINDILDISKIENGRMSLAVEQVSLKEVMNNIVCIVQQQVQEKKQHFNVYVRDIMVENVCCDSVRLNQIFLNLLSNAIKFTPEGGTIQVAVYEEPSAKGSAYIRSHIRVKDNGVGMTKDFLEKIFDSFMREDHARVKKAAGAGVGMAITKYIVDAMGGTIEIESEPNKGTEVHVTLDLEKAPVQEVDMVLPQWRMLVVDDDEMLCESVVATLKTLGIRADWAVSAARAVEMAQEHKDDGESYEVVLIDWQLPDGDGIQVAKEMRANCGEEVCILLTSAYDWDDIKTAAHSVEVVNGALAKPLFKSTLYYGLRKYKAVDKADWREEKDEVDFTGKHVLLAEDNDLNWEIAEELLSELGLNMERAENGRICKEMFAASKLREYDAILMDLRMPEMTGYEATTAIRAMSRPDAATIPIIAMSADTFPDDIKKCLAVGMNAHVAKPIDVAEIASLLKKFMTA